MESEAGKEKELDHAYPGVLRYRHDIFGGKG